MPTSTRRQAHARDQQNNDATIEPTSNEIPQPQSVEADAPADEQMDEDEQNGDEEEEFEGEMTLLLLCDSPRLTTFKKK